jgi:hypothetical protein
MQANEASELLINWFGRGLGLANMPGLVDMQDQTYRGDRRSDWGKTAD